MLLQMILLFSFLLDSLDFHDAASNGTIEIVITVRTRRQRDEAPCFTLWRKHTKESEAVERRGSDVGYL